MTLYAVSLTKFNKVSNMFSCVEPDICVKQDEAIELANYMIRNEVKRHLDADLVDTAIRHTTSVRYGKFHRDSIYIDDEVAVIAAIQETEV